mgnify:CR=1 FL=1
MRTAAESFTLQSGQIGAELVAQIQRTRQALAAGMVETAASFMSPAYAEAAAELEAYLKDSPAPRNPDQVREKLRHLLCRGARLSAPAPSPPSTATTS